jgi:hypothetical protein
MGKCTEQTMLKGRSIISKYINTSTFLALKKNGNQNYIEISPHSSQNGYHQEHKQQMLMRMQGEKGALIHCWW